jgi:D-sedoheptulose 7-phosphate isomerase
MTADVEKHGRDESEQSELLALVEARFAKSMSQPEAFFAAEAGRIAEACWAMARRFHQGGRLLAFGNGASATDAQHVAVEFVHPVIVGKRALPALALTNDSATLSGLMASGDATASFAHQLRVLARPQDIAIGFSTGGNGDDIMSALVAAKEMGLLTLGLLSDDGELPQQQPEYCFVVPSQDPLLIQEIHETLYHILWELVHIYFEHEGLLQ